MTESMIKTISSINATSQLRYLQLIIGQFHAIKIIFIEVKCSQIQLSLSILVFKIVLMTREQRTVRNL